MELILSARGKRRKNEEGRGKWDFVGGLEGRRWMRSIRESMFGNEATPDKKI